MAAADPELRERILGNARAAARERILNRLDPQRRLPPDQAAALVDRAWREELAHHGRKGAATNRANAAALRDLRTNRDQLLADLEGWRAHINLAIDGLIQQVRAIGAPR